MSMTLADLVAELKASLHDSATVFKAADDADFKRFLSAALPDMQVKRPLTRYAMVQIEAGTGRYALATDDFAALKTHEWGDYERAPKPWEPSYPGKLPLIDVVWDSGQWWLTMTPAPTALHTAAFGRDVGFWYFAKHVLSDVVNGAANSTTVNEMDKGLLLLRAQAEAMRELAIRNVNKPVQLRDGLSGTPRNSTPSALYEALMRAFGEAR